MAGNDENTVMLFHCNSNTVASDGVTGSFCIGGNAQNVGAAGAATSLPIWNCRGNASVDTSNPKFGTGCLILGGSPDCLSATPYTPIGQRHSWTAQILGANDAETQFDLWVKHDAAPTATETYFCTHDTYYGSQMVLDYVPGDGIRCFYKHPELNPTATLYGMYGGEISDSEWHHIAVCRSSTFMGMYLDGQQVAYETYGSNAVLPRSHAFGCNLSTPAGAADYFVGRMDAIRSCMSNQLGFAPNASLTDSFSVPAKSPTKTVDMSGRVLLDFENLDAGATRIRSYWGYDSGTTQGMDGRDYKTEIHLGYWPAPKFGNACMGVDAYYSSDALQHYFDEALNFEDGVFTYDMWFMLASPAQSYSSGFGFFGSRYAPGRYGGNAKNLGGYPYAGPYKFEFWVYSTSYNMIYSASTATIAINGRQWYHAAFIKGWDNQASMVAICIDGEVVATDMWEAGWFPTASQQGPATTWHYIGTDYYRQRTLHGYLDEVRVSNVARWTENFTPPTAAYTFSDIARISGVADTDIVSMGGLDYEDIQTINDLEI